MTSFQLSEIAGRIDGIISPSGFDNRITGISGIEEAGSSEITFLSNRKYYKHLKTTKAAAVLIEKSLSEGLPLPGVIVDDPYFAFREILIMYYGERPEFKPGIAENAIIGENFSCGDDTHIGEFVVIGENVSIGDHSVISAQTFIGDNVSIGDNCLIHPGVKILHDSEIGNNVIIHPGAVIGSDGFGFAQKGSIRYKIPQVGKVVLEDDVDIGANTTIDRATVGETRIKRGTKIDNLVQVAHNISVGEDCAFAAQVGISGSSKIGNRVILAGQVGLAGHLEIGDDTVVAAQSGVPNDVPPKSVLFGYPARDIRLQRRIEAIIGKLPDYIKRLRDLEKKISK